MELKDVRGRSSVDYMLRTTQQHHVQLSFMADQKANIVIAFSSVVFTVSITQIAGERLLWAFPVLAMFSGVALVFAIQSVFPRYRRQDHKRIGIALNPLFFGHFTEVSFEEYKGRMARVMSDDTLLYEAVLLDIYQIGHVLKNKKYRYLKMSYQISWLGLVAALATLFVQMVLHLMP